MRKFFGTLLIGIFVAAIAFYFAEDWILSSFFEKFFVEKRLFNFETKARKYRLDLLKGALWADDLVILNPPQFENRIFADIPELFLRLDLLALLKKERVHFYELKMNIREINIEKGNDRVSNVLLFKSGLKGEKKPPDPQVQNPKGRKMPFHLERFELSLDRMTYHDRSSTIPKKLSVQNSRIEREVFYDINDPKEIAHLVLLKVITKSPFDTFGLEPNELRQGLTATVGKTVDLGEKVAETAVEQTRPVVEGTVNQAKEAFKQVQAFTKAKLDEYQAKFRFQ